MQPMNWVGDGKRTSMVSIVPPPSTAAPCPVMQQNIVKLSILTRERHQSDDCGKIITKTACNRAAGVITILEPKLVDPIGASPSEILILSRLGDSRDCAVVNKGQGPPAVISKCRSSHISCS